MTIYNAKHLTEAIRAVVPAVMAGDEADARGVMLNLVRMGVHGTHGGLVLEAGDGHRVHTVTVRAIQHEVRTGATGATLVSVDELNSIMEWIEREPTEAVELSVDPVTGEFEFYIPMRGVWDMTGSDAVTAMTWLSEQATAVRS